MLNQGLLLISPIILARLLSVEDFGRYREFLLYAGVLMSFATLGINGSLLRFIPDRPELKWRYVEHTVLMTFASSVLVAGGALLIDAVSGGKAIGEFVVPAVIYVLVFVNLDFWEFLLLAEKRSLAVLGYTTGRLVARMTTVITAAALTHQVHVIVWSVVCLETARLVISFVNWRRRVEPVTADAAGALREQLQYVLPFGGSMLVISLNRSLGNLFVAKMLGPVGLAHYAIGTYVAPVVTVLRNSLSDVLLPEMVARARETQEDRLLLFRRTTVMIAIFLVAAGVLIARFAQILIETLFSAKYLPAVGVLQLYVLVFVRESLDFGVPLRAMNYTAPILRSSAIAIVVNGLLLAILLPRWGLIGAVVSYLISRFIEGGYLGAAMMRAYSVPISRIAPWPELGKIVGAAALAALLLYGEFWTEYLGFAGVIVGSVIYLAAYALLLVLLRVPAATSLLRFVLSAPGSLLRKPP